MNEHAAYARPLPCGRFWAMLRFPRDSHPKPVMAKGGKPQVFETELEAEKAIRVHLIEYMNGDFRRDGVVLKLSHRAAAEKVFEKPTAIYSGGGRKIAIERRASR